MQSIDFMTEIIERFLHTRNAIACNANTMTNEFCLVMRTILRLDISGKLKTKTTFNLLDQKTQTSCW